jgi:pentatricopeptide repeat protein
MIKYYLSLKEENKVLELFKEMEKKEVRQDLGIFNEMLDFFSKQLDLDQVLGLYLSMK